MILYLQGKLYFLFKNVLADEYSDLPVWLIYLVRKVSQLKGDI